MKLTYMIKHAIKIPILQLYQIFNKSEGLKKIINTNIEELDDSKLAHILFNKLDMIADAVSNKLIDISNELFALKRVYISPTGKFQIWVIEDKIIIISESAAWIVLHDTLILEGELFILNSICDEDEQNPTLLLYYPVHDKYIDYKISLSDCEETNLEHHDKATVLWGIDTDELDTSNEYDETNRKSTVFMNRRKNMKKVITHAEEIEVTDKPISILRCEVEACSPEKSHEQCFLLKPRRVTEDDGSVSITDTLDVENITYGNISVVYQIYNCRSFDIPSQKQMEICGCLKLSYKENKIFAKPINGSKLTLTYSIGEHFELELGDEITNGSMTLLRYYSESDEWSEWGEEWN